jgi:type I restriction enzyme, R subunit
MLQQNITRANFAQRFQVIIDNYNAGDSSNENYYDDLADFAAQLKEEAERHIRDGPTEEELELFDVLKKKKMTQEEEKRIKLAAKSLLYRLLEEQPRILVQDWYKDSQSQAKVKSAVEEVLGKSLPDSYHKDLFRKTCDNVYRLIFEQANSGSKWIA